MDKEVDKVANEVADMLVYMNINKVADMVVDMEADKMAKKVSDMVVEMVVDMVIDKVAYELADMVVDMEVDKVANLPDLPISLIYQGHLAYLANLKIVQFRNSCNVFISSLLSTLIHF